MTKRSEKIEALVERLRTMIELLRARADEDAWRDDHVRMLALTNEFLSYVMSSESDLVMMELALKRICAEQSEDVGRGACDEATIRSYAARYHRPGEQGSHEYLLDLLDQARSERDALRNKLGERE